MTDDPRPASRFLVLGAMLCSALVAALLVAWVMDARATGQPAHLAYANTAPAPAQSTSDLEMAMEMARGMACQKAALAAVEPADKLRASWAKHRGAHHDAMDGKITEAQMKAIWRSTLRAWETEDPAFGQARDAMVDACRE